MTIRVTDLVKQRAAALDEFTKLATKTELNEAEKAEYPKRKAAIETLDEQIKRERELQALSAETAQPVGDQDNGTSVQAHEMNPYEKEDDAAAMGFRTSKGLRAMSAMKIVYRAQGNFELATRMAAQKFGERHSVTRSLGMQARALLAGVGNQGGYIVPPDYINEIIELLRPKSVVRSSNPRVMPMPRGTMTLPGQATAAVASYGSETGQIASSNPTLNEIVASYKKLTALTPVTNDLMRYADPAADAFVRDDLVKVIALREDLAFLLGDGTQRQPRGMLSFANGWVIAQGGTGGNWSTTANSTYAVNAADTGSTVTGTVTPNTTGGNFITSTELYTTATVANELGGMSNRLDTANVPEDRRQWFFHPRIKNYLYNVQNAIGVYIYRDEMNEGKLLGYPFKTTTQIGTNYWDTNGANKTGTFIFLAEMDELMILDSMSLELAVSREGSYVDASGTAVSAFQNDQTLIRAIAEHDFQMRHWQSVAINQGVLWAPAIS